MMSPNRSLPASFAQNIAVAIAYLVTAKLGFTLALEHTNATVLWPPTGIALAVCFLFGLRIWPGIFLGAFLANMMMVTGIPFSWLPALLVSLSTACGNTLEALIGASLVRRFTRGDLPCDHPLDAIHFILLGALASPAVSATIGAVSFSFYSSDWTRWSQIWQTWWLGDAVGALVFAPILLTWEKRSLLQWDRWKGVEAVILLALLLVVEIIVFYGNFPLEYLIFPVLFWTAFRFGQFETAITVAFVLVTSLLWTVNGFGPFAVAERNNSLLFLQSYLAVVSASTLLFSTLIAARNSAEMRLREYQDNLENLVRERTAELQGANDRLVKEIEDRAAAERDLAVAKEQAETADRSKSAFLATMSHELRTPLNSIIGFTGILLQKLGGPLNDEQEKQLTMVRNSASHLLSLISDVLDISKIEAAQLTVASDPFNFKDSVLKIVQSVRPLAEKKGLDLTVDISADVGVIFGDVRRVEQILLNLLSNAVKFTDQGGIHVTCHQEAGEYIATVSDTGIGIREEDIPHIFKPFQQIDTGLSRKYEGTGLGLSICRRLANLMGGEVGVRSTYGSGSTFWFTIRNAAVLVPESTDLPSVAPHDFAPQRETSLHALAGCQPDAPAAAEFNREEFARLSRTVYALLAGDNLAAADFFDTYRDLFAAGFPSEFNRIEGALRRFDFPSAAGIFAREAGEMPRTEAELPTSPQPSVLVVDDIPNNIALLGALLKDDYRVKVANNGLRALSITRAADPPDLILLDIMMPGMDGYEVCRQLKADPSTKEIPVIFLTARTDLEDERKGLELGAVDYITKPFSPAIVKIRVRIHLALKAAADFLRDKNAFLEQEVARRTDEVKAIQEVTILALASLAETRDTATGNHLRRTQQYVRLLAQHLKGHPGFSEQLTDQKIAILYKSAPLHDIGKVGIPDRILLKKGELDPEEFAVMKTHTTIGRSAIENAERSLGTSLEYLHIAKEIILHHQEKWDGSGYPEGLSGADISVYARLMSLADAYDALISRRVYREGLPHEKVVEIITAGRGNHFDPVVVDAFLTLQAEFQEIARQFADAGAP